VVSHFCTLFQHFLKAPQDSWYFRYELRFLFSRIFKEVEGKISKHFDAPPRASGTEGFLVQLERTWILSSSCIEESIDRTSEPRLVLPHA